MSDYKALCAELTNRLDELLVRSIHADSDRHLNRNWWDRLAFWRDIPLQVAQQTLVNDVAYFELIQRARVALSKPEQLSDEEAIAVYYEALAKQHQGKCVYVPRCPEEQL